MRRSIALFVFTALALAVTVPTNGSGSEWRQLKPGLTPTEASALLGKPLLASRGNNFEVATYDRCGELLFLGGHLIAWSAPHATTAPASPLNTWSFVQHPIARSRAKATRLPVPDQRGAILPSYRWQR